ncbi:hypothetical protein B7494_g684 [Chlorociboria aeruginascens]|nr:hypothetical protein B7494_g684 [Chlorociboria aeruginascens]
MKANVATSKSTHKHEAETLEGDQDGTRDRVEDEVGRLFIDDGNSRYISGSSWANLVDQIGDLRVLLENDNYRPVNELLPKASFPHHVPSGIPPSRESYSQAGLGFLWEIHIQSIDPIMKVFRAPSMQPMIDEVLSGSNQISKGTHYSLAAIKFAAVTSLTNAECWACMNTSRQSLLDLFRSEVQAILDVTNYLVTHSLITFLHVAAKSVA